MEQNRKIGLIAGSFVLVVLTLLMIVVEKEKAPTFYWGGTIGILFGIGTCVYLSEAWDPIHLRPTDPNTSKADWSLLWVVPLGVITVNILSDFMGEVLRGLLLGCLFPWLEITLAYFVIQAWRYRPK